MQNDNALTTVTETVILKMTKRTISHSEGTTEIIRDTEISLSETVNLNELNVLKFVSKVLNGIPEHVSY